MIHNVRIHLEGELPVLADLNALPRPTDISLLCTNLRTTDGKQPRFIEHSASWFVIPLTVVRFLEMPASAVESALVANEISSTESSGTESESDTESAPILLPGSRDPGPAAEPKPEDFELDEAFLQRIRDI